MMSRIDLKCIPRNYQDNECTLVSISSSKSMLNYSRLSIRRFDPNICSLKFNAGIIIFGPILFDNLNGILKSVMQDIDDDDFIGIMSIQPRYIFHKKIISNFHTISDYTQDECSLNPKKKN